MPALVLLLLAGGLAALVAAARKSEAEPAVASLQERTVVVADPLVLQAAARSVDPLLFAQGDPVSKPGDSTPNVSRSRYR
jgi:hypothetical protein